MACGLVRVRYTPFPGQSECFVAVLLTLFDSYWRCFLLERILQFNAFYPFFKNVFIKVKKNMFLNVFFICKLMFLSSMLQITNRSFRYASPYLWNQLPSSFYQPHSVHSPPGSPHPAHITSSQSPPSLSPSITSLAFHSRLKTHLFHKSFPLYFHFSSR